MLQWRLLHVDREYEIGARFEHMWECEQEVDQDNLN